MLSIFGLLTLSNSTIIKQVGEPKESIYDIQINDISGQPIDLHQFKGKKILFVNTASKCGFTPQYKDLEQLHQEYGEKVQIIGLPCNQFLNQEPGEEEEIASFCEKNYGVSFLMTEKIDVKGKNQHPLYAWLTQKKKNGSKDSKVQWNFQKYLVNEKGELVAFFSPKTNPLDSAILDAINK